MKKNCNKCKKEFEAKEELDLFCSDECKQEALADLDSDSDECLSCQYKEPICQGFKILYTKNST